MKSIRYYYFASIAAILVVSMLVLGILQAYLSVRYFRSEKEQLLTQLVMGVAHGTQVGQIGYAPEQQGTIDYMAHLAGATVFITDQEGKVLFSTDSKNIPLGTEIPSTLLSKIRAEEVYKELSKVEGLFQSNQYAAAMPTYDTSQNLVGYVFATSDASELSVYLWDIMSGFISSAIVVLLVASAVALVFTDRMLVPIRRISRAAQQFGEGNYAARVPVEGSNELARLAITFNEMANSFESTDISRRSFMGNIAHELRTPMTTIKGFIDGIQDGTIPPEQQGKYLKIVSQEVARLARLTMNMLDISRLEAGDYAPEKKAFDIGKSISAVLVGFEHRVEEKQIQIKWAQQLTPLLVMADEDFVHQVLLNLLENAIKFTEANGEVVIGAKSLKGMATISIRNSGGIAEKSIPNLFDRFYKTDQSRGNGEGSGLGLHICKVLTGLMGGRIWASSDGTTFTEIQFTLPLASGKKGISTSAQ